MTPIRIVKLKDAGPLHDKLLAACPPDAEGTVSIAVLAGRLEVSTAAVYKWISEGKVPSDRVPDLIKMQWSGFGEIRVPAAELNSLFGEVAPSTVG